MQNCDTKKIKKRKKKKKKKNGGHFITHAATRMSKKQRFDILLARKVEMLVQMWARNKDFKLPIIYSRSVWFAEWCVKLILHHFPYIFQSLDKVSVKDQIKLFSVSFERSDEVNSLWKNTVNTPLPWHENILNMKTCKRDHIWKNKNLRDCLAV